MVGPLAASVVASLGALWVVAAALLPRRSLVLTRCCEREAWDGVNRIIIPLSLPLPLSFFRHLQNSWNGVEGGK